MDIGGEDGIPPGIIEQNDTEERSNLNISDVFEAISIADPSFGAGVEEAAMYRTPSAASDGRPYVRIVEQPASKALRFRYECEGRSAGSIPGVNSTSEKKTYPTIEICGHKGRAIVVVSCVTKDRPFRPHPHNLVGREMCKKGVCTANLSGESSLVTFSNLGIQCVKRKDIADALRVREEMRVDPYKTGFAHKTQPQSIDLNAVRLCFQVFLPEERTGKVRHALPPVVSDIIYDKKAMSELLITRISRCSGPARGGTEIILLCEKVVREDTAVVLVERRGNSEETVWEGLANISQVHKQFAIVFTTPAYTGASPKGEHVQVHIQLKRLSDDARSPPVPFEYTPDYAESDYLNNKRKKALHSPYEHERLFQTEQKPIKSEPKDKTPPHAMGSPHMFPSYGEHDNVRDHTYQQWARHMEASMPGSLVVPGPSHLNPFSPQDMSWPGAAYTQSVPPNMQPIASNVPAMSPNMQPVSPNMQPMSPNMQAMSPNMQAMSPNMQAMSPNMQAMSPNMQAMSPNMQAMSPNMQAMSPMGQVVSPMGQVMSPMAQAMSPIHGGMSPNIGHVSPNIVQQMPQQSLMETVQSSDSPSISGLLRGEHIQLDSSELRELGFSLSLLGERNDSDSLNRISTTDLLQHHDLQ